MIKIGPFFALVSIFFVLSPGVAFAICESELAAERDFAATDNSLRALSVDQRKQYVENNFAGLVAEFSARTTSDLREFKADAEEWVARPNGQKIKLNLLSKLCILNSILSDRRDDKGSQKSLSNTETPLPAKSARGSKGSVDRFGSLWIDKAQGNAYGWAVGYATQEEADQNAQAQCDGQSASCTRVMWFKNSCGSYAIDSANSSTAYGWAYTAKKSEADVRALEGCRQRGAGAGANCLIRVWGCTSQGN